MPDVILVGMMGSGKSTVGRMLAEHTGVPFSDTDALLEFRLGRSIPQMFKLYGEEAFREHETAVLKSLEPDPGILATGGGVVLRDENWTEFRRLGQTVFLDVRPDILMMRLEQSARKRPLLEFDDWQDRFQAIYDARLPLYLKADTRIEIGDEEFEVVVERILNLEAK